MNQLHPVYLTKAILPQLGARSKKSAILITASSLGFLSIPGMAAYCSTKRSMTFFGVGLSEELK